MPGKLDGKVAVVVGATSGMGRATALSYAREGASLVISGRRAGLLQELGEQIAAETGKTALGVACDAGERDQVESLINSARAQFGRIDILVYASGMNHPDRSLAATPPEKWEQVLRVNLTGAFHCTQVVAPVMREQGEGLIIYISSLSALRGDNVSGIPYQASKRGLDGISLGVMAEEKQNGIRTSVVYPGLCDTPLVFQRPQPPSQEVLDQALLPEDVAEACLYIAALPPRCHVPELTLLPSRL